MKSYLLFLYQHCRNVFFKQLPEHRRVLMTATHVMPILAGYLCGGEKILRTQHKQSKLLSGKIYEDFMVNNMTHKIHNFSVN